MPESLRVIEVHEIIPTSGSGPLLCTLSDGNLYYCKKSNRKQPPYTDLINEVLGNENYKACGISVPEYTFATFEYD